MILLGNIPGWGLKYKKAFINKENDYHDYWTGTGIKHYTRLHGHNWCMSKCVIFLTSGSVCRSESILDTEK